MNCFMGYNPLVTKQVKVTVWVCEQDGATPVAPSNPSEGDCFIVYATDEAMLSNTPTSAKTYTNGDWADAEGGGGKTIFPTFTRKSGSWLCDLTYSEAKAVWEENKEFALPHSAPCHMSDTWSSYLFVDGETFAEEKDYYEGVPADVTEGITAWNTEFQDPPFIFGSDGNFYLLKD